MARLQKRALAHDPPKRERFGDKIMRSFNELEQDMPDAILVLNAGSSSIKFGLFEISTDNEPVLLCKGLLDEHDAEPQLTIRDPSGNVLHDEHRNAADKDDESLLVDILNWIDAYLASGDLLAVGHRSDHRRPAWVDPAGAAAPAALPGAGSSDPIAAARIAAGRLLRHGVPSRPRTVDQRFCDSAKLR
jgi:hypothetical protein